jgi:3-hydroxyacyl-CoA dehydrogenase/enoyl-CoA hydratase/3-hydroxybutyryl-CoA epimerase
MIRYQKDTNDIVTLTLDMDGRLSNILNHEISDALVPVVRHLQKEKSSRALRGIIITSAKKNFLTGGDLEYLYQLQDSKKVFAYSEQMKKVFRDLERPGVPVVAAINGNALGTGFELALACHHRIVLDHPKIQLGHPEVELGLMPGAGGIIRLMWLLGIEKAFPVLEGGRSYSPAEALELGLIDEVASGKRLMIEQAKNWILQNQEGRRKWDTEQGRIPGGGANTPRGGMLIRTLSAEIIKKYQNRFPASRAILNTLAEGSKVDFDTACRLESRYYAELVAGKVCKNMIKTFWFDYNAVRDGENRPKGFGRFRPKKVGVIGAGLMGSGIAVTCVLNDLDVVLKDVSKPIAQRGKDMAHQRLKSLATSGIISQAEVPDLLNKISTTELPEDFSNCDLVIEAVFENVNVKAKVTREAETFMDKYSFLGTNSTSIPITNLANASIRPENYVGLHFFYPAEEVPLVEIVRGKQTSDETIARAFDFVRVLRKIPIIVKDDWGFYAARTRNTYILEGITMLQEGYSPAFIDNMGILAGMPRGPLQTADEISLKLVRKYEQQAADHYGPKYIQHPAVAVLDRMLNDLNRPGGKTRRGFYETDESGRSWFWEGLEEHFPSSPQKSSAKELMERFLFAQVLEALWCLQEHVITSVPEANLGSIYGWGFPSSKGGVLQYIRDYGLKAFIRRAGQMEKKFGPRFKLPSILKKKQDWLIDNEK